MNERCTVYGANLAVTEETANGNIAKMATAGLGVMIGLAIEGHPTAEAREKERTLRLFFR